MTGNPAAITAQLVDVRNVAAHKSVRLELHVPAEQAGLVMAAFGWPTMAEPVPVALARLVAAPEPTHTAPEPGKVSSDTGPVTRRFSDLPYSQQAAMRCQEADFSKFMTATGRRLTITLGKPDADEVADCIRELCGVMSRRELDTQPTAGARWREIEAEYYAWSRGMR